jgi:hypothetical protein
MLLIMFPILMAYGQLAKRPLRQVPDEHLPFLGAGRGGFGLFPG